MIPILSWNEKGGEFIFFSTQDIGAKDDGPGSLLFVTPRG